MYVYMWFSMYVCMLLSNTISVYEFMYVCMILFHLMINNKKRKKKLTMQKSFGFANFYDENFTFTLGVKNQQITYTYTYMHT